MARDPNRIPAILQKLEDIWMMNPDQRLGQLFSNIMQPLSGFGRDPSFYIEDDVVWKRLEQLIEDGTWGTTDNNVEIAPVNL